MVDENGPLRRGPRAREGFLFEENTQRGLFSPKQKRRYFVLKCNSRQQYFLEAGKDSEHLTREYPLADCISVHVSDPDDFMTIGSRIYVPDYGAGVLRYFGTHGYYRRDVVGVELDEAHGEHDGRQMGHRYFTCRLNHGLLCAPGDVFMLDISRPVPQPVPRKKKDAYYFNVAFKTKDGRGVTLILSSPSFEDMQGWIFALSKAAFDTAPAVIGGAPAPVQTETYAEEEASPRLTISVGADEDEPWFHSKMSRTDAEKLLNRAGVRDGLFLVRESTSEPGNLVITMCSGGRILHVLIVALPGSTFKIGDQDTPAQKLRDLVIYLQEPRESLSLSTPLRCYVPKAQPMGEDRLEVWPLNTEARYSVI